VALVQSGVVIVAAFLIFNVQIVGIVLLVLLLLPLTARGMKGMGSRLSSNALSEFQALQQMPLMPFPTSCKQDCSGHKKRYRIYSVRYPTARRSTILWTMPGR
jgi:hypothetical protein